MSDIEPGDYIVICREDTEPDGTPGRYVLATRQHFKTRALALKYKAGISPTRQPHVARLDGNPKP
jgi:hypothetical protein